MKCPVCSDVTLQMTERKGVEIDYCPTCRGIWLDRGELDKIIDKEQQLSTRSYDDQPNQYSSHQKHGHKRRKSSFLGDLFDF